MKLCWWTYYPTTNQTAIIQALRAQGVDVVVCYFCRYDSYRRGMGWREEEPEPWEHYAPTIAAARRAIPDFDSRIQMVPGYSKAIAWRLILRCLWRHQPWFIVTEGTRGRWFMRPLVRAFAFCANRAALAMFCHGQRARAQYRSFGVAPEKLAWLGYALSDTCFLPSTSRPPSDTCRFIYVGALSERKAVDILAAAWREIAATYPHAVLRLVGDGELRDVFDGLPRVERRGAVAPAQVGSELAESDVLVLPSRYDAWGVALAEGAAAGLALIATSTTGASELIRDGVNGFRIPPGAVAPLVQAIAHFAADPSRARACGVHARVAAERLRASHLATTLVRTLTRAQERSKESIVASFWEEHCTECGEPACYATCPHFEAGWGGRCRRVNGADGKTLVETITGCGPVQLRTWGKLELLFHGRLTSWSGALRRQVWTRRFAWARRLWARLFRSLRWRAALVGASRGTPNRWRLRGISSCDAQLVASVVDAQLTELARWPLVFKTDEAFDFSLELPSVETGALFRLFALNGEPTGVIDFTECALVRVSEDKPAPFVKCLAWDLDGTLWDGTLAEDGVEALVLRPDAVALVKVLDARGVVNSIVSRNEPAEALAALKHFGLEDYFVFPQIGWGPKSDGLKRLAREMNVAVEAVAFVDDRPEQRGEVAANVPAVRVFAVDEIPTMAGLACFNPPVSAESASRRLRYREEMARRGAEAAFAGDAAAFLAQSELTLTYFDLAAASEDAWARCWELVQRCNQLHLTGRRYTPEALRARVAAGRGWGIRCRDKYGDYGIVGLMVLARPNTEDGVWSLVEFVMSCRVAKKGCERQAVEWAQREVSATRLKIEWIDTGRNAPLHDALMG
ncbi:MAG: HAD-IIIC family phosphatase [Kiritimatiellae bacterium]|nr:HAD-IIIC family phosphatase [Kiritimatiellia bacterium]